MKDEQQGTISWTDAEKRVKETTRGKAAREVNQQAKEATAYHEAGHAVVALAQGLRMERVTIKPSEGSHGHARASLDELKGVLMNGEVAGRRLRNQIEKHMRQRLAGSISQRRFRPLSYRSHHSRDDDEFVLDLSAHLGLSPEEANVRIAQLGDETDRLIKAHWPEIIAVATALLERETLSAAQLRRIVSGKGKGRTG